MNRRKFFGGLAAIVGAMPVMAVAAVAVKQNVKQKVGQRISVLGNDPGFLPNAVYYRVHLNGVEVTRCFTADETLGEVHRYREQNGQVMTKYGEPMTEVLHGKVEILGPFYN